MTAAIEATSLSAVQHLASNPPPLLAHLSQLPTAPLVLYIARVPGSRDVFLTPVKPRERVVTAEDVQSSLYYVHVNSTADYDPPEPLRNPSSANTDASQLRSITEDSTDGPPPLPKRNVPPPLPRRRQAPLPYPLDDGIPALPLSPPSRQKIHRKPILSDITNSPPTCVDLPVLPPRPLPSMPDEEPARRQSLHEDNIRLLRHSDQSDLANNPYTRDYATHPETFKQLDLDSRPEPGSLTLIRRDPGRSTQSNVASIYDPPVLEVSSSALLLPTAKRRTKKSGAPLYLDITNPAYLQFNHANEHCDSRPSSKTSSSDSESLSLPEGVFRRRLFMPGSRDGEHAYGTLGHRQALSIGSATDFEIRRTMREERHSFDSASTTSGNGRRRGKGYTFSTPWQTHCEFTTGATGRSLKCRHHRWLQEEEEEVSELRFNLPTSKNTPTPARSLGRKYSNDGSYPAIVLAEDGSIDLSLGQERAGGGFGGREAKLGKLIIWPAGLPMLDLLVAANLGLWWRAYERG